MKVRHTIFAAALPWLLATASVQATSYSVDFGGQVVQGDTASSKLEEYTDIQRGFFVESLEVSDRGTTGYYSITGSKPGLRDQRVDVEAGNWLRHRVNVSYSQIPHVYSNSAQSYLHKMADGVYELPDGLQADLQTSTANASGFFSQTPFVPLAVDRKQGQLTYRFTPSDRWRLQMSYSGEKREGEKAMGVSFGHGQTAESLEPVKYQTHDLEVGTEFVGKNAGFMAGYRYSNFLDEIKSLTVDNPLRQQDSTVSSSGSSTPGRATLTLPPSNQNHQANVSFQVGLPAKSRLSVNSAYSIQTQDDAFQPVTSNRNILNDARFTPFTETSLNGRVDTWNSDLKWNWKPTAAASTNLYAKHYRFDNKTPSILVQNYVPYDAAFATSTPTTTFNPTRTRRSQPVGYNRTNAGADFYYAIVKSLSMKMAYDWEQYLRDHRETHKTTEDTATVSLNYKPAANFSFRPSYQYKRRHAHDYDSERVGEETYPLGEGTSLSQLEEMRKYDQASRIRNRVGAKAEWDVTDFFNLGVDAAYTQNNYIADYGLLGDKSLYYGVDIGILPSDRITLNGGYTWERVTSQTQSRYRETAALDVMSNDWVGQLDDLVQTVHADVDCVLVKNRLDTSLGWSMTYAKGTQQAYNPNTLQGTTTQVASAFASDLPNTYNRLHQMNAALRYHFAENVSLKAQYAYQRYTETDWTQDSLDVYQASWNTSVFLGATQPSYEAHIISLGLSYKFL